MIVEKQGGEERAKYGDKVIKELSERLTKDFGEGYDERNLRYMRYFYSSFSIWNAVRSELTWTHYRLVMRIKEKHIIKKRAVKKTLLLFYVLRFIFFKLYKKAIINCFP